MLIAFFFFSFDSFFLGEKWETPNPFGLQVTENRCPFLHMNNSKQNDSTSIAINQHHGKGGANCALALGTLAQPQELTWGC